MSKYEVERPELVETKQIDAQGRVYLGKEYAGKKARIILEEVEDNE